MTPSDISNIDIARIPTYQSGIIQASAFRIINRIMTDYLAQYDLSVMQWFAIGLIHEAGKDGLRLSELSRQLSTTLPYVTNMVTLLESKGVVKKVCHGGDSCIKIVGIRPECEATVEKIEHELRLHVRSKLYVPDGVTQQELQTYITVLYKIVKQAE